MRPAYLRAVRIEPASVVAEREYVHRSIARHLQSHVMGLGVPHDVGEPLLHDTKQRDGDVSRQGLAVLRHEDLALQARLGARRIDIGAQRRRKSEVIQQGRAQGLYEPALEIHRLIQHAAKLGEALVDRRRIDARLQP